MVRFDLFFNIHRTSRFGCCCISDERITKPLDDGLDPGSLDLTLRLHSAEIKRSGGREAQLTYVIVPDAHKANYN